MFTALFSAGLSLAALSTSAQHVYVDVRPTEHVVTRPARPDTHHVWVGTEWTERDGKYEEVPAHWDMPPHGHKVWVAGHWAHERRGHYWIAGHWS